MTYRVTNYNLTFKTLKLRELQPGSPSYSFTTEHGQCQAVRKFATPWFTNPDIPDEFFDPSVLAINILEQVIGFSSIQTGAGGKYVSREVPMDHPSFPDFYFAEHISFDPDIPEGVDSNDVGIADEALLTVRFGVPQYNIMTDTELFQLTGSFSEASLVRYVEVEYQPGGKYQTLPAMQALLWDDTKKPVASQQVVLLVEGELLVIWKNVPVEAIPMDAITELFGQSNQASFGNQNPVIGGLFPITGLLPETLVMQVPQIKKPWRQSNNTFATDIGYRFKYYPFGANAFYRWDNTGGGAIGFFNASRDGTGANSQKLYPLGDFTRLFKPPP